MGGANNRSLISAYFLTAETYKRMRLTTRVYGIVPDTQLTLYTQNFTPSLMKITPKNIIAKTH